MANASSWIGDITAVARDHVDVQVRDGLAGSFPDVDSNVVALWRCGPGVELPPDFVDELEQSLTLLRSGLEPAGYEPAGHDERMTGADREAVADEGSGNSGRLIPEILAG